MRTTIKNTALALSLLLASGSAAIADDFKVATMDMQRALQSVEEGKKAKAALEKEFNARKKELETEKAGMDKAIEEFKKQSLVMSDEARAKKQGELQERGMKLQEKYGRSQGDIAKKEMELTKPIVDKLRGVIADLAKAKGYQLVLERNENTVLYSQDGHDLTNEAITAYNKKK